MRRFKKYEQLFFVPKKVFKNLVKKKKSTAPMKIYGHYFIPEVFFGEDEKNGDLAVFDDVNIFFLI